MGRGRKSETSVFHKDLIEERRLLKLWRSPIKTSYYFLREVVHQLCGLISKLFQHKLYFLLASIIIACLAYFRSSDGPHQALFSVIEKKILWWSWWILLGFLSACGLGSGLHTFVLYLGPFIAEVTMSAFVCRSLNFPEPPYPDLLICPSEPEVNANISFFRIVRKVQLESVLWGLGTALGELPPYFMARSARLSSSLSAHEIEISKIDSSASSLSESEAETEISTEEPSDKSFFLSFYQRLEMILQKIVTRAGFFGILLCASVPNPLFDLAGMTCGHFLVSFSSFFGATLIGKAIIKVHIQQFAVIAVSSDNHIDSLVEYIGRIPLIGQCLQLPLLDYLQKQKSKLQHKFIDSKQSGFQVLTTAFVTMVMLMFIISIIHAMALNYQARKSTSRTYSKSRKKI